MNQPPNNNGPPSHVSNTGGMNRKPGYPGPNARNSYGAPTNSPYHDRPNYRQAQQNQYGGGGSGGRLEDSARQQRMKPNQPMDRDRRGNLSIPLINHHVLNRQVLIKSLVADL